MSIRQFLFLLSFPMALHTGAQAQMPMASDIPSPTVTPTMTLNQALQAARNNLEVSLGRSTLAAARADILSANRSPFPVLSAKMAQMDLQNGIGDGNFLTQKRVDKSIGMDWTWERGNKRELRTLTARNASAAALADLDEIRLQQLLATQSGFFDLLGAQERVAQIALIERSASQLAQTAQKRVLAGDLAAQDAARTEIEAQRAQSDLLVSNLERERAGIALWQLTGVNMRPEQLVAQSDWPAFNTKLPTDADLTAVVDARSDVKAAQARVQAAQSALDASAAQRISDVTVGASYDHYPGTSTALLELRMQMPLQWGYSYQGEIARASAQLALANDALEKTRRLATAELQRLRQEALGTAQRALRYETDILPRARRVAENAELAYGKGALSLTDLLDARRTLRATLLDALATRTDFAKAAVAWQLRTQPIELAGSDGAPN